MTYTWDIKNWISRVIGSRKRKSILLSYIYIFLSPIEYLHGLFLSDVEEIDNKVKFSSQQLVLSTLLNDLFDPTSRRIRIETASDAWTHPKVYYRHEEAPKTYLYYRSETGATHVRYRSESNKGLFKAYIPSSLASSIDEIKAWLNHYKEASKTYQIVYI